MARADAADAAAAASVAAAAAAADRDQVVEATLRDLNARMGTASAGGPSTAPAGGQNGADLWPVGMTHGRDSQRVNEATTTNNNNNNHNIGYRSTTSAIRDNHDNHHNNRRR